MFNPQEVLNNIHEHVSQVLPGAGKATQEELSNNLKVIVSGIISKLDLVSRDEFDAQQIVLERTREKLDALEKQMEQLNSNS